MKSEIINPHHFNPRVLFIMRRFFTSADEAESHTHDFLSLIYIMSGDGKYEINGKTYDVCGGMFFICNPNVTHHRILSGNQRIEEFHVGISNLHIKGLLANYLIPTDEEPLFSFNHYGASFTNTIGEIVVEQQKNDEGSVLMLKCIVMKLLVYIIKERYVPLCKHEKNVFMLEHYEKTAMINNIRAFITENYMEPISLAKISENTYLSPVYVSRVFKEATGESPINYLIKVRLLKACELLNETSYSIKKIASYVGYADAYYFSKLFKKYFGMPPVSYRKAKEKPEFKTSSSRNNE